MCGTPTSDGIEWTDVVTVEDISEQITCVRRREAEHLTEDHNALVNHLLNARAATITIWGVVWHPERESEPVWYDDKAEAVEEYNHRSDKYWTAELVTGVITEVTVKHSARHLTHPWDRDYAGHYYEESASGSYIPEHLQP